MIFLATLAVLLINAAPKTSAALPNFLQDVEEDSTYHNCDSAMCWWTTFDIEVDSDFSVPNSSLVIADYNWDWWEVKTSSLLKECAPSLPLSQIAYSFSACNDMEDDSIKEVENVLFCQWHSAAQSPFLSGLHSGATWMVG